MYGHPLIYFSLITTYFPHYKFGLHLQNPSYYHAKVNNDIESSNRSQEVDWYGSKNTLPNVHVVKGKILTLKASVTSGLEFF